MTHVALCRHNEITSYKHIPALVIPGGGKSLLPVLVAHALLAAGVAARVCWVVPRDSPRLQAEEAFANPGWRAALGHALSVRAAENAPDPSRGLAGYVTTYQAVAAAPALHLAESRRHPTLLVLNEAHHLPALDGGGSGGAGADGPDPVAAWSAALLPLLSQAGVRLLLSGTLERSDGRRILWLPYRRAGAGAAGTAAARKGDEVDLSAPGWAVVGYFRAQALSERAVLPVRFGVLDGEASWLVEPDPDRTRAQLGPHRLGAAFPSETTRPALFTALRTGFADALLREAFDATRQLRARRRARLDAEAGGPGHPAAQSGKGPGGLAEGLDRTGQGELLEAPSRTERRLRSTVAELVAAQAVEDTAEAHNPRRRGYHAYNAVLKRVLGKGRAEMALAELEAAVAWLGRNRLRDHLGVLEGDTRYAWDAD